MPDEHNSDTELGFSEAADILTESATFDGVADVGDVRIPIRVREPDLGEIEALEADLPDDAEDVDVAREMVDDFLVKPDLDPSDLGITRAMALFTAMRETWQQTEAFESAREDLPLDEGNR